MSKYHYFNDTRYPILVSKDTVKLTPHTWSVTSDLMHESTSIQRFFTDIPRDKRVNIIDVGAQSGLYILFAYA